MFEQKEIEKKRQELRKKKQHDEECKEVCSFKPKTNTKKDFKEVQTRYLSPGIMKGNVLKEINVQNTDNGYQTHRPIDSQRMKWVKD